MHVEGAPLAIAERLEQIGFLDVHVKQVQADAAVRADLVGQRQGLVAAVDQVGLEAVQRLDRQPDAGLLGMRVDLAQPLDQPLPFELRGGVGNHLADRDRHHGDNLAVDFLGQRDDPLHVVDRLGALRRILCRKIPVTERERHRAPGLAPIFLQQRAHFLGIVLVRLAGDLQRVDSGLLHAFDGAADRLRPHPVVRCNVHRALLED